ncbi:hypothetical Protein YC6258_00321 [Gynuella sunshinyii YC6258]|uniref:Uncharacterized protein n=1 Tax=Gynuella sunshinyii YC6258 TaxID=1445510 RepID=A0A0C5VDT9_9GAMM|nr:hypothetical Protein YC6258_00321 [Gynuella sunshinyii YC6258]
MKIVNINGNITKNKESIVRVTKFPILGNFMISQQGHLTTVK